MSAAILDAPADHPTMRDPRTRLMPYGRTLSIAPQVTMEPGSGRNPAESVVTIRFGVSWT